MATFEVTDPNTGRTLRLTGDSPPTEQELEQIFAQQAPAQPAADQQTVQPTAAPVQQDAGVGLQSFLGPAATIASGVIAEPLAGLAGIAGTLLPGDPGQGARFVEATREALTFQPETEEGQRGLQAVGEVLQPVGEALQTAEEALGGGALELTGSPAVAAAAATLPTALIEAVGLRGFRSAARGAPKNVAEATQNIAEAESVRSARKASEQSGIGLFKAQQTLNPTDIERQAFVASLPAGAVKARQELLKQNQQAADAVNSFLDQLAPPESITTAAPKFRKAAQRAIEGEKLIRRQKTSPIYNEAFSVGADIDLAPVRDLIASKLDDVPESGEVFKSLKRANALIKGKEGAPPSLKRLHNAKLELDQMLNKFGDGSLGNTTKAQIAEVKDTLLAQMDEGSDLYRQAREEFSRLSPNVDKLNDSIIGSISGLDDVQLKNVAQRVFDPAETNPAVLQNAKQAINGVDPDAWNTLLRSELERRMGRVRTDIGDLSATAATENVPAQLFNSVFGNKKSRDVLFNAVDGETKKNLRYLEVALKRATKGRPGGSQTAIREEIKSELRGGSQAIREFLTSPFKTTSRAGAEAAFDNRVKTLSNAMFDPQWRSEMKAIRQLPMESSAAQRRMQKLLSGITIASPGAIEAVDEELAP